MRAITTIRYPKSGKHERGVVLVAVLMFIALILPVTLLILDSVRIESLLPVNEAYSRTAGDEANKGFNDALAAIMADQDPFIVDITRDITSTNQRDPAQEYWVNTDPDSFSGEHEFDYLAEMWARHPENDTVFLVERSLENIDHPENIDPDPNEDEHSVPVRWQLMNVPFGMDDFGEYYPQGSDDSPKLLLPFEYVGTTINLIGEDRNAPAFYIDSTDRSMLELVDEIGDPPSHYSFQDLAAGYWQLPPSDPNYYTDITRLIPIIQYMPRPASYFRNTNGEPEPGQIGLPANEGGFTPGFMREDNDAVDRLVYDGLFDFGDTISPYNVNQYPLFMPLQQACADSAWSNTFFGATSGTFLTATFVTSNREYKPAPGTLTRYQLGAQESDAIPGWHMAIVSDESGRFPINSLLNIIYASQNIDYYRINGDDSDPWVRRDQFDDDFDDLINNNTHPNHGGFLMARDILISLLMTDGEMALLADDFGGHSSIYVNYKEKATWIIRQMLQRRWQLDVSSDYNRNGDLTDDTSAGEIFQHPELTGNNNSPTLDIPPPGDDVLDGSGRMGDAQDLWDGTWRVFTNPKDIMTEFLTQDPLPADSQRLTPADFQTLNQRVTVYTMDTEHTTDPEHASVGAGTSGLDVRYNIQHMMEEDDINTQNVDESALFDYIRNIIGHPRTLSIIHWRDGLVDLNGDGDLDDEFIEQPVTTELYDPANNAYDTAGDEPVSTLTYRERNHPNFQDPSQPQEYIDPDFLNIRSLGDLITIPMSTSQGLIAYSLATDATDTPELTLKTETGNDPDNGPTNLNTRSVYPDFSNAGSEIAYDDEDDVYRNNLSLTNESTVEADRRHPSWAPSDALMCYYEGDEIRLHDMNTDTDSLALANAGMPPDIDDTTVLTFWDNFAANNLIGDAEFEMGSPDISPNANYNEIAFTQVASGSDPSNEFLADGVAYNIAAFNRTTGLVDTLTENDPGDDLETYDYAPDFSPNGEEIVFTRTTFDPIGFGFGPLFDDSIPYTFITMMDRQGGGDMPLLFIWDYGPDTDAGGHFVEILSSPGPDLYEWRIHQAMFPNYSPDGQWIIFMDIPLIITMDWTNFPMVFPTILSYDLAEDPDIYMLPAGQPFRMWNEKRSAAEFITDDFQIFPDWGLGNLRVAEQGNMDWGYLGGSAINMANAQTTDSPFDEAERRLIAQDIGVASLALRRSIGMGADDQNWRLKDLPAVPEHMVDVLEQIGDVVCFRDPYVTYDPQYDTTGPPPVGQAAGYAPLQAYPGRININTATRPVLRSLFLLMFQGPENDVDDDNDPNGPQPRYRSGMNSIYLNLMDPNWEDDDQYHFTAMMIADRYAHQLCEYRRWIYNNQGALGITDETVPSNLPLYEQAYAHLDDPPISHYGNYRANPFYPLIDVNQDGVVPDMQRSSPDPPFRSVANLFSVMLFDNDAFSEDWTYEGIGGNGGPDDFDLPEALDVDGNPGFLNALEVWGPIYNASDERACTHPDALLGGGMTLTGFEARVDNDFSADNEFYEHQAFRLFSADDFRRIASWLTVRTYNYRIESRGVVRVSSGANRTDITRDKIWIITMNTEASFGTRLNPTWDIYQPLDTSFIAQNRGTDDYYVLYFEDTPQSGFALTRDGFLPE